MFCSNRELEFDVPSSRHARSPSFSSQALGDISGLRPLSGGCPTCQTCQICPSTFFCPPDPVHGGPRGHLASGRHQRGCSFAGASGVVPDTAGRVSSSASRALLPAGRAQSLVRAPSLGLAGVPCRDRDHARAGVRALFFPCPFPPSRAAMLSFAYGFAFPCSTWKRPSRLIPSLNTPDAEPALCLLEARGYVCAGEEPLPGAPTSFGSAIDCSGGKTSPYQAYHESRLG